MLAESLQSAVVVMSHVAVGLLEMLCGLFERVSLEKRQPYGLALISGELRKSLFYSLPAKMRFEAAIVKGGHRRRRLPEFSVPRVGVGIEVSADEIFPPIESALVGRVDDHAAHLGLRGVVRECHASDKQKNVL